MHVFRVSIVWRYLGSVKSLASSHKKIIDKSTSNSTRKPVLFQWWATCVGLLRLYFHKKLALWVNDESIKWERWVSSMRSRLNQIWLTQSYFEKALQNYKADSQLKVNDLISWADKKYLVHVWRRVITLSTDNSNIHLIYSEDHYSFDSGLKRSDRVSSLI